MSDLLNPRLTPPTGGGAPEGTRGVQFTQSLCLPTSSQQGAGKFLNYYHATNEGEKRPIVGKSVAQRMFILFNVQLNLLKGPSQ